MANLTVESDIHGAPGIPPREAEKFARVIAVVIAVDAVLLTSSIPIALFVRFGLDDGLPEDLEWFTGYPIVDFGWIAPVWLMNLAVFDAYSKRNFARGSDEFKVLLKGSFACASVVAMTSYLVNYDMSRGFFLATFVIGTVLLLLGRLAVATAIARLRNRDRLVHRVVAFGGRSELFELNALFARRPELGYRIVAICIPDGDGADALPLPVLHPSQAVRGCGLYGADTLLIAGGSATTSDALRRIGWELADTEVDLIVVPNLIDVAGPRIHLRPVSGLPFLHIEPPQAARAMTWGKAVFDRVGALLLLISLAPLMALVAAAVWAESGRPIFFRHARVGAEGRRILVWKFRSMALGAEALHSDLVRATGSRTLLFKAPADPRVTRVGSVIRRYSLDELPQLLNVLLGQMSLVGPRPQVPAEVAQYGDFDHRRLLVRPGMTGLWQVSGRSTLGWDEAVRLDLHYVDNWSMAGDLVILFKTVRAVLKHDGAF